MPDADSDPRVYFAAERTMLAWLRTGISVMAFGFVVARFGLFLRVLQAQGGPVQSSGFSPYLGAALVALGVLATGAGAVQFHRFYRTRSPAERPAGSSPRVVLALSWAVVLIGAALVVVLVR
ncbi:MAG: YidH family protein [Gemmatimonadaceae bacterium]